jgi:biopolymer transport protein ExbB
MGVLSGRQRTPLATFVLCCLLAVFTVGFVGIARPTARAQDAAAADAGDTAGSAEGTNLVSHIITAAGPVFGPLLLIISIILVALIVLLAMDLRMAACIPPEFVEEFTDTVNKRRFKEAFEMARNDNSFIARVLAAGMARLQYGIEDAREIALNTVENVKASKEQLITYLATIGTLGPMIGLVGTVFGMIKTFMVLHQAGKQPNAQELAGGISQALVITLLGIAISVPAIFFHAFFRNRLIRISMDASNIGDDLLTQMYHNSRKAAPTDARAAAAPTATVETRGAAAIKPAQ